MDGGSCVDDSIVERLVTVEGKCEGDCAERADMGVAVGSRNGMVDNVARENADKSAGVGYAASGIAVVDFGVLIAHCGSVERAGDNA